MSLRRLHGAALVALAVGAVTVLSPVAATAAGTRPAASPSAGPRVPADPGAQLTTGMMPPDSPDAVPHANAPGSRSAHAARDASSYLNGVDVASYQHPNGAAITWSQVAASGQSFVVIKATESTTYTNPYEQGDVAGARQAGLRVGLYHFARPSLVNGSAPADAVAEADYFSQQVNAVTGAQLPPTLDLEVNGGLSVSQLVAWTSAFLTRVQTDTGRRPMIYTGPNFWNTSLGGSTAFTSYPLWEAHYTTAANPQSFGGWSSWTIWQWSDGTYASPPPVPGISSGVDRDRYSGSLSGLEGLESASEGSDSGGASYTPTGPTRVLDTRTGVGAPMAPVGPAGAITLTVPNLPTGTTAVVLNLTGTGLTGAGTTFVSACPTGQPLAACTATSALNPVAGQTIANEITVPVGPGGTITLYNHAGSINLVADLAGYVTGGYTPTGPTRVLDTRTGVGAPMAPVGPAGAITLTVPNLPTGTTAVVLNLTGTGLTGAGTTFVSACPTGQPLAACTATSALNPVAGQTIANEITVPVGPGGTITLYNHAGSINLVADLAGYVTGGYTPTGPTRVLDTRTGVGAPMAPVGPAGAITLTVPNLPTGTTAVVLNLTGTGLTGAGTTFVSACPTGQPLAACTATSALNPVTGQTIANEITVPVGPGGTITLYNHAGSINLVADLAGAFSN